jgi:hypothetical protein
MEPSNASPSLALLSTSASGMIGLIHISELSTTRVAKVTNVFQANHSLNRKTQPRPQPNQPDHRIGPASARSET